VPSTAGTVMTRSAAHLNDLSQLVYTSAVLLPFFNMALDELEEEMAVFELTPLKKESIIIDVPAGSQFLPQMPIDFVESVALFERNKGSQDIWAEVGEVVSIDRNYTDNPTQNIVEWTVRGPQVFINPPSAGREAQLSYIAGLAQATGEATALDIESSRRFLALLTARNAARDLGNSVTKADSYREDIIRARDRLIGRMQKNSQDVLGTRRRPYTGRGY
jgi:hypothetical protein